MKIYVVDSIQWVQSPAKAYTENDERFCALWFMKHEMVCCALQIAIFYLIFLVVLFIYLLDVSMAACDWGRWCIAKWWRIRFFAFVERAAGVQAAVSFNCKKRVSCSAAVLAGRDTNRNGLNISGNILIVVCIFRCDDVIWTKHTKVADQQQFCVAKYIKKTNQNNDCRLFVFSNADGRRINFENFRLFL